MCTCSYASTLNSNSLQAIFIGHGPAFRKGYVSEPFANVELYNLMCGELRERERERENLHNQFFVHYTHL